MSPITTRVFVYGTLKRGDSRHDALSDQRFIDVAATQPAYRLYDLGEYPGLVTFDSGDSIPGELYEVDADCLQNLDVIEGVAEGYYSRQPVKLLSPFDDQPAVTYIFEQSVAGHRRISQWPDPATAEHQNNH